MDEVVDTSTYFSFSGLGPGALSALLFILLDVFTIGLLDM